MDHIERMHYKRYKQHFADCQTVPGSYNTTEKTISVILPEGRLKPSGVRGERFMGFQLWFCDQNGEEHYCTYRAVCMSNAEKQHRKYCKKNGWRPIDTPEGKEARIFM